MIGQRVEGARVAWLFMMGSLLLACGGAKPPQSQLTAAQSAVRAAEVGGAEEIPKGKLHLKFARDQIKQASDLMAEDENEEAARVLQRAEIDAQYALALAQHQEARQEAEKLLERIDELMDGAK
jgi:hypothetical protein